MTAPVLRLIRGSATAEELGAVVALLASRSGAPEPEPEPERRSLWATPQLRPPLSPGPGAWRASGLPR